MRSNDNNKSESIPCVQPQCHEFDANVLFNEHGLNASVGTEERLRPVAVLKNPVSRSTAKSGTSPCTTKIPASNTPETKPPTELRST